MTVNTILAAVEPFNWNALISLLSLLAGIWIAWQQQKRNAAAKEEREILQKQGEVQQHQGKAIAEVATAVEEVKDAANGVHHEMLAITGKAGRAEGKLEGQKEERQRGDDKAAAEKAPAVASEPLEVKVISTPTEPVHTTPVKKP